MMLMGAKPGGGVSIGKQKGAQADRALDVYKYFVNETKRS